MKEDLDYMQEWVREDERILEQVKEAEASLVEIKKQLATRKKRVLALLDSDKENFQQLAARGIRKYLKDNTDVPKTLLIDEVSATGIPIGIVRNIFDHLCEKGSIVIRKERKDNQNYIFVNSDSTEM